MHAICSQSKETAQPTTVFRLSRPCNDLKFDVFTCFSLTPTNGESHSVSGLDQIPHTSNRHLAHNHLPHRETSIPTHVRGNDCGSHMHPPCRQNRFTENHFRRRGWIHFINHQTNARQHRFRHAVNNEPQNSKRRPYHGSRIKNANNCHTLPLTQL